MSMKSQRGFVGTPITGGKSQLLRMNKPPP